MRDEMESVPVAVAGLGEVGRRILAAVLAEPSFELVGAADPALAGRPLAEVGAGPRARGRVESSAEALVPRLEGGVLLVATSSRLAEVAPLLKAAAAGGVDVVTTCEEMAWPWLADPDLAEALDEAFADADARAVATGVNPGFVLDRLPALVGTVAGPVRRLVARRVVDLSTRRVALQKKMGVGLSLADFESASGAGRLGHVGLAESAALVAESLGVEADELDEVLEPLVAEEPFEVAGGRGEAGSVAGLRQVASAFVEGREVIRLELAMYVGAEAPTDEVMVEAEPPIHLSIPGGIPGEEATARAVVSAARTLHGAPAGLLTVLDLPLAGGRP